MGQLDNSGDDKIILQGMRFYGFHGNRLEERILGQHFKVNLKIETETLTSGVSDDLADTVNYSDVYKDVRRIMEEEQYKLLERLAETISSKVLSYDRVKAVEVEVSKLQPSIKDSQIEWAGVQIYRRKPC